MSEGYERYHPDMEAVHHSFQTEPCFICSMVQGEIRSAENIINENEG